MCVNRWDSIWPKILGEHAPDALKREVAQLVWRRRPTLSQGGEETGDEPNGILRHSGLSADEHRLVAREEHQRVEALRQFDEVELSPRRGGVLARLPDLEAMKGAEDNEMWGGKVVLGIGGIAPIAEGLLAVLGQVPRLARALHLDEADPRPDQVQEAAGLWLLEPRADLVAILPVGREQLVEERLCLGALAAVVEAPLARELDEVALDLFNGHGPAGP